MCHTPRPWLQSLASSFRQHSGSLGTGLARFCQRSWHHRIHRFARCARRLSARRPRGALLGHRWQLVARRSRTSVARGPGRHLAGPTPLGLATSGPRCTRSRALPRPSSGACCFSVRAPRCEASRAAWKEDLGGEGPAQAGTAHRRPGPHPVHVAVASAGTTGRHKGNVDRDLRRYLRRARPLTGTCG